jgi:biopolymer transport protein ExbD
MRRFSQKNALVTLSDINVTPLLDLAFVLLIIFVITTPLLEQSLPLDLPRGGRPDPPQLQQKDIQTVEITADGRFELAGDYLSLDEVEQRLWVEYQGNPNLVVAIRADKNVSWEAVAGLMDRCQRRGITRVHPRMAPER